ncbi:acyl--CoA ligase [Phototrophicus methaneseepsis]|uniref:Acyl--CoA ligase n=1 Tax=Phototrophicus methaneseepsis TaxID=2710758 RepID=A0A7S8ECX0_9CHLR|nr:AMP-binding protein [Phototrophicus methaneseepsis]QPC84529.1 acyl--CoA ligase [Phototrophicus methaneseepsis]
MQAVTQAPSKPLLPFRNIRDVLALHAKTSASKSYILFYDRDGERMDLAYAEFVARVHQVANFLYDDLKLKRGDRIATLTRNDVDTALILFGAWVIGLSVMPLSLDCSDDVLEESLKASGAMVCFTDTQSLERVNPLVQALPNLMGQVEVGGEPGTDYVNFLEVIRSRPTTFLGDDSGAKAADLSLREGNERTATFSDEALYLPTGQALTQGELLYAAKALAEAQALTGNQRQVTTATIQEVEGLVAGLIAPLVVGASVVWCESPQLPEFWARVVREKANLAHLSAGDLQGLVAHSQYLQSDGETLYGHGINRTNLARFRHVICNGRQLEKAVSQQFETLYGFPILVGLSDPVLGGFATLLPMMLSWEAHQDYLHVQDERCMGVLLPGYQAAVDQQGVMFTLPHGEQVRLALRARLIPDDLLGRSLLYLPD